MQLISVITRRWHGHSYKAPMSVIAKCDIHRAVLDVFLICECVGMAKLIMYSEMTPFLAFAFVAGCYFVLYFSQGFQTTSYFGTLIHLVIFTDIISFGFVFFIMLVGFGGSMMLLLNDHENSVEGFETLSSAMYSLFRLMAGFGNLDTLEGVKNSEIVTSVVVLFVCLTIILILNMLIAAISESYSNLVQLRNEIWIRNRLSVALRFEQFVIVTYIRFKLGKYMSYDNENDRYGFLVETSDPATCC